MALLAAWRMQEGEQIVACSVERARKRMRDEFGVGGEDTALDSLQQRDSLQLAVGQRSTLPTFTRGRPLWICGGAVGQGRYMAASEAAGFMGIRRTDAAWTEASKRFSEPELWDLVADSVDSHMADVLVANCLDMCELLPTRALRYGSIFSGALDPIFEAFRRAGAAVRYATLAESVPKRRASLASAHGVPPEGQRRDAHRLETLGEVALDVLTCTPSCRLKSVAAQVQARDRPARAARAKRQVVRDAATLARTAAATGAWLIIVENTAGLATHHPELLALWNSLLPGPPFVWRHGVVDARALGAVHGRRRLGWVGYRRPSSSPIENGTDGGGPSTETSVRGATSGV